MKKVKSICKKVMSVGLAASLLLAPASVNECSAAITANDCTKVAKISIGLAITAGTIYCGLKDTEATEALIKSVGSAIGGAGNLVYYSVDSVYQIIKAVGVKNTLAGAGLWQVGKWAYGAYNKIASWFNGEQKNNPAGVQNFNVNLKIQ